MKNLLSEYGLTVLSVLGATAIFWVIRMMFLSGDGGLSKLLFLLLNGAG